MFNHHLTVALRQIVRNKSFSAINVLGLSLGMTCCTIIFLWVMDEKAVDNFHKDGDRLYNVYMTVRSNSGVQGVYMLANTDMNENKTGWSKFISHPDWKKLTSIDEYKGNMSNITRVFLKPVGYSQI